MGLENSKKFRFIAIFDILGFKKLVEQKTLDEIHSLMQDLFTSSRTGTEITSEVTIRSPVGVSTTTNPLVRLNYFIFSDTILVWKDIDDDQITVTQIEGTNDQNVNIRLPPGFNIFNEFCIGINRLIEEAMLRKIPLRGGIAFGECIISIDAQGRNHEIIGQPIVDAYLVEEAQDWVGVAFHSSCSGFIELTNEPRIKEYKNIPLHRDRAERTSVLNYSLEWGGRAIEKIEELIAELEEGDEPETVIQKYRTAIEYCRDHSPYLA